MHRCAHRHKAYTRKISRSLYTTKCIEGWIKPRGPGLLLLCRANSCEVLGQAGGCLTVSLSLCAHPAHPELHCWQDMEWILARKPSKPVLNWIRIFPRPCLPAAPSPQCWVSSLLGGRQSLHPPPSHNPQRPCARASVPSLSARPHHWPSWHGPDQLDLL